jgi:hypothetical protein
MLNDTQIIIAATMVGDPQDWEDRNNALQKNIELLNSLRWGSGDKWKVLLEAWWSWPGR